MGNIFDYLAWRGDLTFKSDPFNDVDNLVLSELSYVDFDGMVLYAAEPVPLAKVRDMYFSENPASEIRKDADHIAKAPLLMNSMLTGGRFASAMMTGYINRIDTESELQMAAVTFLLDDGTAYVSFRGTDSTIVGWKEDFNMSYKPVTPGQKAAAAYLSDIGSRIDRPLRVGGHSKGGNFAVYASAFCDEAVRDRIIRVYTNDGPGFRREVMETEEYRAVVPKVRSIVPETSVIAHLLRSDFEHIYIRSNTIGLAQHDSLTWRVERSGFVSCEQSGLGSLITRSQKDWLSKINDEERESFVNALFSILESTGMDTLDEIYSQKLKSLEKIGNFLRDMPKTTQKEMSRVIGELIASGTSAAISEIEERRKK